MKKIPELTNKILTMKGKDGLVVFQRCTTCRHSDPRGQYVCQKFKRIVKAEDYCDGYEMADFYKKRKYKKN